MKNLWCIETDMADNIIISADNKEQVGKYIKKNIKNLIFIFQTLLKCDYLYGKIKEQIEKIYSFDEYLILSDSIDEENVLIFTKDIEKILSGFSDEEIVDELWGHNEDFSIKVSIKQILKENIIEL